MEELVEVKLELSTLATLIAGLYCTYSGTDPLAIPSSLYVEIAEKLMPHLEKWDYSRMTIEEWIKYSLLIIPKMMVDDDDLKEFKENDWYFERDNGNIMLIVTARMG